MGHMPGVGEHNATFYLTEEFLVPHVGTFISDGIAAGDQILVIATLPHWNLLVAHFEKTGAAHGRAAAEGRLVWLDAEDLLEKITGDEGVSVERFRAAVGHLLSPGKPWRVYGELVSLLAERGDVDTAIAIVGAGARARRNAQRASPMRLPHARAVDPDECSPDRTGAPPHDARGGPPDAVARAPAVAHPDTPQKGLYW